jgi:xanthine dehydrogenase YagS FAD-binding subunit
LPPLHAGWRGQYLKARERTAGDFPIVSLAFGCRVEQGLMRDVRLVLGGVAPVPRPCPEAEAVLEGQPPSRESAARAADAAFARAAPLAANAYKIDLGRSLIGRAVEQAGAPA